MKFTPHVDTIYLHHRDPLANAVQGKQIAAYCEKQNTQIQCGQTAEF